MHSSPSIVCADACTGHRPQGKSNPTLGCDALSEMCLWPHLVARDEQRQGLVLPAIEL